ncbi:MaoC family dehydratase [Amycolatopsis regifaucium]|uniref:Dehydratase n=1 Tax=Amycolatopsis regifaucium TaxID=546365 RepID=A0A154MBI9_9PSEU|nr:MaoC family dehydratase [Amycolatopsis regifaucium]KZB82004.1 dehydratase [Amycolatopsis regifaucium]OKA05922.1 dehydratase [Amycolatopsis regifaucium]SFG79336.1 MaoC like domain-containing protein [Amycolatopsis regifaucium]
MSTFTAGEELPPLTVEVTREQLVRYAGASLDFNPIHWNEAFAKEVGLPDVIAHGMLTMALGARLVTDWLGDPGRLVDYFARFTRPVVVPNDGAATIEFTGKVAVVNDDGTARIDITAKFDGKAVLGKAQVIARD